MGREKGCKQTKAQIVSNKAMPPKPRGSVRERLKEIVSLVMFEDEQNITDSYNMMEDVVVVDQWLDPIEIVVAVEKEFGIQPSENPWPEDVFRSFGKLLEHVESLLGCPAMASSASVGGR